VGLSYHTVDLKRQKINGSKLKQTSQS